MISKFKVIKIVSRIHAYIYSISRGMVGKQLGKVGILILTTTGRKSGKRRSVPLAAIPDGENYILVASFGGSPVHPSWLINIRHNPVVDIRVGSVVKRAKAYIIETTDAVYDDIWAKAVVAYKGFDDYKNVTSRNIPVVVVTPV